MAERRVDISLTQRIFFKTDRQNLKNKVLLLNGNLWYLDLKDVLEILEYDYTRKNNLKYVVTDGSEFVTIPRNGGIARREGVSLRIDPLILNSGAHYISLRSINRLFNVDLSVTLTKNQVFIRQPGRFFIAFRGDTVVSVSSLLNTSIKKLIAANKNLKDPIAAGTRITIPASNFVSLKPKGISTKSVKIKQSNEKAPAIIAFGRRFKGTPYKFGAAPYPRSRQFDCSSYMQYIFGKNGIRLPRTARAQARVGKRIRQSNIQPGHLLFFRSPRYSDNRIGHDGVDIGNGFMLNTYQSPPGVTITRWRSPYWLSRYVTAREIL